jgi:hypothetical protein
LDHSHIRIRRAAALDFPKVRDLLLEFENPGVTDDQWRQLFVDHSGLQEGSFGYVMEDGAEIVGFLGVTVGQRTIRDKIHRFWNISNWIVRPAYRRRSLELVAQMLEDSGHATTITALSPAPHVLAIFKLLKFEMLDTSERVIVPSPLPAMRRKAVVLTDPLRIEPLLDAEARVVFRHHQLPHNKHMLVRAPEGDCHVVMNRSRKRLPGGIRLPLGRLHHVSSPNVFVRHADRVVIAAAARFAVAALVINERTLAGRRIWHSFPRPGGARTGAFKSDDLGPEDIDGLYSEAVLLNY